MDDINKMTIGEIVHSLRHDIGLRIECQHELDGIHKPGNFYTQDVCEYILPSLDVLIDCCGKEFSSLVQCSCTDCKWNAHAASIPAWNSSDGTPGGAIGMTPQETVARLLLMIHFLKAK